MRLVTKGSRGKVSLCQKGFPVPQLYIFNVVIRIVRMGVFCSQFNLYPEFFTLFCKWFANNKGGMPVEVISPYLLLLLADINGCKYSGA